LEFEIGRLGMVGLEIDAEIDAVMVEAGELVG
jgi:hypothetical protein